MADRTSSFPAPASAPSVPLYQRLWQCIPGSTDTATEPAGRPAAEPSAEPRDAELMPSFPQPTKELHGLAKASSKEDLEPLGEDFELIHNSRIPKNLPISSKYRLRAALSTKPQTKEQYALLTALRSALQPTEQKPDLAHIIALVTELEALARRLELEELFCDEGSSASDHVKQHLGARNAVCAYRREESRCPEEVVATAELRCLGGESWVLL
ncbi:uncharacterized protein K452DRAFT_301562 [Aplosporella prunicola CBS 121167]|uniref:Uncharacterized protein n=1 Tax=Aplosporella prunicola CBS 121167 TaxID=1176127 RepID=A0A6A6B1B6_9PEZI|nr:uncharacterized protein K452DRAFT_301562 [Aplosporella prunicola CBS 121167]KAF2137830.1 hypothetical protein K452DRAFT_301562 [Aplosporella prunicola CBS 121167]